MSGKIYNSSPATSNITPQSKPPSNSTVTAAVVDVAQEARDGTPKTASSHMLYAINPYIHSK